MCARFQPIQHTGRSPPCNLARPCIRILGIAARTPHLRAQQEKEGTTLPPDHTVPWRASFHRLWP
jgi:hypothetical protein